MTQRAVIIGSGLGGLSCGVLLARAGYDVTVLEQGATPGGCLQCFTRWGARFETGMHFIGSADPGQALDAVLSHLGIAGRFALDRLDTGGYNVIRLGDTEWRYPNGRDALVDTLAARFPAERQGLERYMDAVAEVAAASTFSSLTHAQSAAVLSSRYQLTSVGTLLDQYIADPLLKDVLCGDQPLYAGRRDALPFALHAFLREFYNASAFRVVGGSDAIARALIDVLQREGGRLLTRTRATRVVCDDRQATGVEADREGQRELYPADVVVSAIHPQVLLPLVDSRLLRPAYRSRIAAIPNTPSVFSVYMKFKPASLPYMNHNFFGYRPGAQRPASPWGGEVYTADEWPLNYLYMHLCHEPHPRWAQSGVAFAYMTMDDVARWADTRVGHRGDDYEAWKVEKAERLLDTMERDLPGLRQHIERYATSTPLTYRDYIAAPDGAMYGIQKDASRAVDWRILYRTKIPNLMLAGQNVNTHGIMGTLVASLVTCAAITGN